MNLVFLSKNTAGPIDWKTNKMAWSSFKYIEKRAAVFFQKNCLGSFIVPGLSKLSAIGSQVPNVLLFGNYREQLQGFLVDPPAQFRIWVLAEKFRNLMISDLRLHPHQVGVIPREYFFEAPKKNLRPMRFPKKFIFAGRASVIEKRFSLAVKVVDEFRNRGPCEPPLMLYNASEQEPSEIFPEVFKFYRWIRPARDPWSVHKDLSDSIYLSFSQYVYEDLGAAPCEALTRGARLVLSDWGGYSDFRHPHVLKVPTLKSWKDREERKHAQLIVDRMIDFISSDNLSDGRGAPVIQVPDPVFRSIIATRFNFSEDLSSVFLIPDRSSALYKQRIPFLRGDGD
jgi:hypothetical protein